jgi:hypothetical protein
VLDLASGDEALSELIFPLPCAPPRGRTMILIFAHHAYRPAGTAMVETASTLEFRHWVPYLVLSKVDIRGMLSRHVSSQTCSYGTFRVLGSAGVYHAIKPLLTRGIDMKAPSQRQGFQSASCPGATVPSSVALFARASDQCATLRSRSAP